MGTKIASTVLNVTVTASSIPVITAEEVDAALAAREVYEAANKAKTAAENDYKAKLLAVFSKLLGINELEDLKFVSPTQLNGMVEQRIKSGAVIKQKEFGLDKTYEAARPAWMELFMAKAGGLAVLEAKNNTAKQYSYGITEP
jgi:hypothetical protein